MLVDVWVFGPERGCLMRVIPVVQELARIRNDLRFRFFLHRSHPSIAEKLLDGINIETVSYGKGLQFVYDKNFDLRVFRTLSNITFYATFGFFKHLFLFRRKIKKERPVLVINDFLPFVPLYSQLFGLPAFGLYNYALKETSLGNSFVKRLLSAGTRIAYKIMYGLHTELLLEQLKPGSKNLPWDTIPVISRKQTASREEIRNALSLSSDVKLVFLSLGGGGSTAPVQFLEKFLVAFSKSDIKFLVSPRNQDEYRQIEKSFPALLLWDHNDYNTQNLIAASDLVIARAGFTTIAESVQHNVPVLVWSMRVHPEIRETEIELRDLGAAAGILYDTDTPEQIGVKVLLGLENDSARETVESLPSGGAEIAASRISDLIADKNRAVL